MNSELSLSARREITKRESREYTHTSKKAKGLILDRLVEQLGWSRANARRQLTAALARHRPARAVKRKPRPKVLAVGDGAAATHPVVGVQLIRLSP